MSNDTDLGIVFVTGGASGLGAAVADAVAENRGTPVVLDRRPPASHYPHVEVDLADAKEAEDAVHCAAANIGVPSAAVTCAGIDMPGPFLETPTDVWEQIVAVNLLGTAAVARAALPYLIERHGKLVTIASTLGHRVFGDASAYCASKFGVVGFTRALQAELKDRVGITMLTPGGMHTAFFDARDPQYKPAADARLCAPRDVADAVVFVLTRPAGCEVKELVVAPSAETSWP